MSTDIKRRTTTAGIIILVLAVPSIWIALQYRRVNLDRALFAAIKQRDVGEVDALLASGANSSARDTPEKRQKPLLLSMKELFHTPPIGQYPTALNTAIGQTQRLSFVPSYTETPHIVRALIAAGADVNVKDRAGRTAILNAAELGYTDCINSLIAARANLNSKDNEGITALIAAACYCDDVSIKELIAAGADINTRDNDGITALIASACYRSDDCINSLIAASADVNTKDNQGKTAFDHAKVQNMTQILEILKAARARL